MWGEAAQPFQIEDAHAILLNKRPDPTWHFLTRPRGGSKSTDTAGMVISWLVEDAPPMANGHVVAASTDQAAIIIDAAAGFYSRTPELAGSITVESMRILGPNGSWVRVLAQSDSGSWGLRDAHFLVADEFCQWPETRGAKRVWSALYSAAPKVTGAKLVVMSSAGEPAHWSREVFEKCQADPQWRVHEAPGPVPWLNEDELASLRWQMLPSQYSRLVLNKWEQDEDRAVSEEDWAYAAQSYKTLGPITGVRYIILVDIGILNDASVMTVMHKEPINPSMPLGPQRAVVDHIERWLGSKKKPIQVSKVEDWVVEHARIYNRANVYADPTQFRGSIQNLNLRGVRAHEFNFTSTSVGQVASALVQTFRNRQIHVPDLPILKDELLRVKLRESAPGVTRLDHDTGAHDDQAVTIGMGCKVLLGDGGGLGASWLEHMRNQQKEQELHPQPAPPPPRMAEQTVAAVRPLSCQHRWFEGRCAFCGVPMGEVA